MTPRTALLLLLVPLALPAHAAPPGGHDHEGVIKLGTGQVPGTHGVSHLDYFAPSGAIGFNLHGAVNYTLTDVCGSTCTIRVYVHAPLLAHETPFALDWVHRGDAEVRFGVSPLTDCRDVFCRTDGEVLP